VWYPALRMGLAKNNPATHNLRFKSPKSHYDYIRTFNEFNKNDFLSFIPTMRLMPNPNGAWHQTTPLVKAPSAEPMT
jgi:hypothetical protein